MAKDSFKNLQFYYFSGTGNTYLVVQKIKEVFESHNIPVYLHRIEENPRVSIEEGQVTGIAFPVVAFTTFPFVHRFIDNLPPGRGTPLFMVDTLGMISGGIVGPLKKVIERKGYTPIGACEVKMPENFYPRKISREDNDKRIEAGLQKASQYAEKLISGSSSWQRVPLLPALIWHLSRSSPVRKIFHNMGKKMKVDHDKCTFCGLCMRLCPVDNIYSENNTIYLKSHCEQCMRCLSFCPENAITVPGKKYTSYRAVKAEDLLAPAEKE